VRVALLFARKKRTVLADHCLYASAAGS
jgi:hypothetical protein